MKQLSIKLNDPAEAKIIENAVILATGEKCTIKPAKYVFISEDFKVASSNDDVVYQKRIEHEISVIDAIHYLGGMVQQNPFLLRSGQKVSTAGKIDTGIKEQFASMCRQQGYKLDDRFENLIAADIKCRIHGLDLVEIIKGELKK